MLGGLMIGMFGEKSGVRLAFVVALVLGGVSLVMQQVGIRDEGKGARTAEGNPIRALGLMSPALGNLLASDILVRFCEQIPYAFVVVWCVKMNEITPLQFGALTTVEMVTRSQSMKWITRSHVHVDRVACPWLISRFVDSDAEFFFVPRNQVTKMAEELGAIPFDAPDIKLGYRDGKCSFETIVEYFGLTDKALLRVAEIVHCADVAEDRENDPLAAGLEAIAVGYSLRFPDDHENLERKRSAGGKETRFFCPRSHSMYQKPL